MRLFFIGWSGEDLGLTEVVSLCKKKGHAVVYWSGISTEWEHLKETFPDTVFHDHFDALYGIPARGIDASAFPPPEPELLAKLLETESLVLTMMNKHFEGALVSERKHRYYEQVQYWRGVLMLLRPDAVIFSCAPHTVYDFVLYALTKLSGIRTVMFEPTWVGDRMMIMSDYIIGPRQTCPLVRTSLVSLDTLSPDIRKEYELHTTGGSDATPVFVKNIRRQFSGHRLFYIKSRSLWTTFSVHRSLSPLVQAATFVFRKLRPNLKKEYERVETPPDFRKPYVYFPLHYQPERNSSPQGGIFVDQLYLAEILANSLPTGWVVYVKEHPTQWLPRGLRFFSYRFRGFYEALAKVKNVSVVPVTTNTYTLTEHARAVATITGTAGFEAMVRQKPVLVFGYPWYRHAPGLFMVRDSASCKEALQEIQGGFTCSKKDVLAYLSVLDAGTFHGYIDRDGQLVSALTACKNAESLFEQLSAFLKEA